MFNGGFEENLRNLGKFENKLDYKTKFDKNLVGGIQILKFKNVTVFFDIGAPPNKIFQKISIWAIVF